MLLPIMMILTNAVYSEVPAIPTIAPKGIVCPQKTAILDDDGNPLPKLPKPKKTNLGGKLVKGIYRYLEGVSNFNQMYSGGYDPGYDMQPSTITTPNGIYPVMPMGGGSYYLPMGLPQ